MLLGKAAITAEDGATPKDESRADLVDKLILPTFAPKKL